MTPEQPDRHARIWLSLCTPPGDPVVGDLVTILGAVKLRRILTAEDQTFFPGRIGALLKKLRAGNLAMPKEGQLHRTLDAIARAGLQVLTPSDRHWPQSLNDLGPKTPVALYVRGVAQVLGRVERNVAIVGTRTPSRVGLSAARQIAWGQINSGRTIVSGGARGIDAVGHLVSLESGVPTIAVLAQAPNRPYPPEHGGLFDDIAHRGAVVSEVPPGVHHGGPGFLARNRLIAALATLTVVVEAPLRSGAISTAAHAAHLDRKVMAVIYKKTEGCSGVTRFGVHNGRHSDASVDNRGGERVLEQWAGEALHWPEPIREDG